MARRAGLPKPTAYRVLGMLVRVRVVELEGTGYRIALRMTAIGAASPEECGPPRRFRTCRICTGPDGTPSVNVSCAAAGRHHGHDMPARRTHRSPPAFGAPHQVWEDGRQPSVPGREPAGGERRAGPGSGPAGGRAERCSTCRSARSTSPRSCSPRAASSTSCWHRTGSPPPSCSASR
ncbi:helix-turn-helix domain-containing protein [Streptomyces luteogriseus]|uniref:helix-turn-helix domain-containing protein n=1 Tax=Streptomyces luteogriseus TaxID=68233 RepID=UPI0037B48189